MAEKQRRTAKDPALQAQIEEAFGEKPPQERVERVIMPSGSKTDLFLTCAWPWGRRIEVTGSEDPGEPARFGSAYHEVLATRLLRSPAAVRCRIDNVAKRFGVKPERVRERVDESFPILWRWLKEGNPWSVDFTRDMHLERSYAIDLKTPQYPRVVAAPTAESHVYEEAHDDELPMTLDLTANARDARGRHVALYLDHKSGFERLDVSEAGQLKSGALVFLDRSAWVNRARGLVDDEEACDETCVYVIAFFHAPANMPAGVYALEVTREELIAHYAALRAAHRARLSEPRSLTPSALCARCPAYAICPTNVSTLVELRGGSGRLALTTPETIGAAHQTLKDYESRFARAVAQVDAEIRDAVKRVGFGIRPDGQEVAFRERPYTNLSLASIERAVGPIEAKKIVALLDKKGVIERGVRQELRAGPPK